MDGMLLPALVAATVATLIWAVANLLGLAITRDRRKLQDRLSAIGSTACQAPIAGQLLLSNEATGWDRLLLRIGFCRRVQRVLLQAYPEISVARFCVISLGIGLFMGALITVLAVSFLMGFAAALLGACVPLFLINNRRAGRQRQLAEQLPNALDFLGRSLRAGHSLSTGLKMMGEELAEPLRAEFRRGYDQHSLGHSLDDALRDMAARIESSDFAFFVTAVLIQRQTGGDLAEVLDNISGVIRQRIRLQQQVKAKTAEGRFTGYVLTAFPVVMFAIIYCLRPREMSQMLHSNQGLALLGTAVFLQVLGLLAIRKLTTVKV